MAPAPVDHCRVLELGCGDGSNLLPIAWAFRESEFVGVDLAARPLAAGRQLMEELKLRNVSLMEADILRLGAELGKFDYIVAHGLFSWVSRATAAHLLWLCRTCLEPNGIAFVSYNVYPGCHLRNMIREMLLFQVGKVPSPAGQLEQAKAFARFLLEGQNDGDESRQWMKEELTRILGHQDGHLYHDDLAPLNQPFYFVDFMSQANQAGLQYLAEADFGEMSDHMFNAQVKSTLQKLASERVLREQYLDFLKCRRFRQTLLCHREVKLSQSPQSSAVTHFWVSSDVSCRTHPADLRPGATLIFERGKGPRAETDYALGKAALLVLPHPGPGGLHFQELFDHATSALVEATVSPDAPGQTPDDLASFLLKLYGAGLVELRSTRPPGARSISPRPVVSELARWQSARGECVTSLFHRTIRLEDDIGLRLLQVLDGTRDRTAVVDALVEFVKSKGVASAAGTPLDDRSLRQRIGGELDANLVKLLQMGLLTA
jgi:SAM-dependent methyltransferase